MAEAQRPVDALSDLGKAWAGTAALATVVVYALGYLSLRAHHTAFGIDVDLGVFDDRYPFAGARFLVFALALLATWAIPMLVLAAVWHAVRRVRRPCRLSLPDWLGAGLRLVLLGLLAFATVRFSHVGFAILLAVTPTPARPQETLSEVFTADGEAVLALRGASLVRVHLGSASPPVTLARDTPLTQLLGARPDGSVVGVVPEGPFGRLATVTPNGSVTLLPAPATREEKRLMAALLGESRAYLNDRKLLVDRADYEDRARRGFDVYIERAGERLNLSRCETAACGQPSLSLQGDWVAYIRDPQY